MDSQQIAWTGQAGQAGVGPIYNVQSKGFRYELEAAVYLKKVGYEIAEFSKKIKLTDIDTYYPTSRWYVGSRFNCEQNEPYFRSTS